MSATSPSIPTGDHCQSFREGSANDIIGEVGALTWLNKILGSLWVKANPALQAYVHDELTEMMRRSLPAAFRRVHFSRFDLGHNTPKLGPIEVLHHSESHIQIELEVRNGDVDVRTG